MAATRGSTKRQRSGSLAGAGRLVGAALLALLNLTPVSNAHGQRVEGRVVSATDRSPLPGVNVFISGTTMGAASLSDGSFTVLGVEPGVHELVFSMVGFESRSTRLTVRDTVTIVPTVRMTPTVYGTGEVVVSSERPKDWDRHLERFTREFLGDTPNAADCEILNPYVLDFTADGATNTLSARSARPLVIENRALGYRMTFVLQDFAVSSWNYAIRFKGQPRFEELEPSSPEQSEMWDRKREATYAGSLQHFLYSLARGSLGDEGFRLKTGDREISNERSIRQLPGITPDSLLERGIAPYERQFYSPKPLHVLYDRESESARYQGFVRDVTGVPYARKSAQHSVLVFDNAVTLHTSGYLYEPYDVTQYGYWIWERIADMLPRDFVPRSRRSADGL